jgi:crotonobetainyl-CoA:carnitine CoA-transferase CaiB-like acyl-CoA transferase
MSTGTRAGSGNEASRAPLAGLRVLDMTDPMGMYCTKLLALMGADVIKIEPPGGDPARNVGPFAQNTPAQNRSLSWLYLNTNKRSITLDVQEKSGHRMFEELAANADILVETFPPGYLSSLDLEYDTLRRLNPRLIHVGITPFGQEGPYSAFKATDLIGQAMGGLVYPTGWEDSPPLQWPSNQAYYLASVHALNGTLIALLHRNKNGRGQFVDVSMQEAIPFAIQNIGVAMYHGSKEVVTRHGSNPRTGPYPTEPGCGVFACKDGHIYVSFKGDHAWTDMANWMAEYGMAGDLTDPKWVDKEERSRNYPHIDEMVSAFTARLTKQELVSRAQKMRMWFLPINTMADVANDPHLRAIGYYSPVSIPGWDGTVDLPGPPWRELDRTGPDVRRAPLPGEHNAEVYTEEVGLDPRGLSLRAATGTTQIHGQEKESAVESTERLPLHGIRVIDLTWFAAGPCATRILSMHGAEVIRVESPRKPDPMRMYLPLAPGSGMNKSHYSSLINGSKLSVSIDYSTPEGLELLKGLLAESDVVINNFSPGVMEALGLGYETVRQLKPDICYASMPLMNTSGPHAQYRGLGRGLLGACGIYSLMRFPSREPGAYSLSYPDATTNPYHTAAIVLAALHRRSRTGEGAQIEVSQFESTIACIGPALLEYAVNGGEPEPLGNRSNTACPHGVFRSLGDDRWCAIAVTTDEEWRSLCEAMEIPELSTDARFETIVHRKRHEDELDALIEQWTSARPPEEVMMLLQSHGVPAGVVQTIADLVDHDPQLKARNHWIEIPHADIGSVKYESSAYHFSEADAMMKSAPMLGEHTGEVLRRLLNLTDESLNELAARNIIK